MANILRFVAIFGVFGEYFLTSAKIQATNSPLIVNLYYETLCPDCRQFSKEQLCPTWEKLGKYFRIEFVPYGNAITNVSKSGDYTIECQHGPKECAGNRLHSCALNMLPFVKSTKFICCTESSEDFDSSGPKCAQGLNIDFSALKTCADSAKGKSLHYWNGVKTSKLRPEHTWVPWILFNGIYNKNDMDAAEDDLKSVVCKYLKPKPDECNEVL